MSGELTLRTFYLRMRMDPSFSKYIQVSPIMQNVQAQQYCVYLKMATLCKYRIFSTEWVLTFGKKRILFIQEKSRAHHQFARLETSNYLHGWDHCACLCNWFSSRYRLQFTKRATSSNTRHNYAHWTHSSYESTVYFCWRGLQSRHNCMGCQVRRSPFLSW